MNNIPINELGNYIESGPILYKGKVYNFDDYYYDGDHEYIMINGDSEYEPVEVGRIKCDLINIIEKDGKVEIVEVR